MNVDKGVYCGFCAVDWGDVASGGDWLSARCVKSYTMLEH